MNELLFKSSIHSCEPEGNVKYFIISQCGQDNLRTYIPDKTRASTLGGSRRHSSKKTSSEGNAGDIHHRRRIIPKDINGVLLIGSQIPPGRYRARFRILGEIILPNGSTRNQRPRTTNMAKTNLFKGVNLHPWHHVAGVLHALQVTAKKRILCCQPEIARVLF